MLIQHAAKIQRIQNISKYARQKTRNKNKNIKL